MTAKTKKNRETPRFDYMLSHLKLHGKGLGDTELIHLFEKHRKEVSEHYEDCVPDGRVWMNWSPEKCPRNEIHGPYFHAGFRKYNVTKSSEDDYRIYMLLSGSIIVKGSEHFWEAHYASMADTLPSLDVQDVAVPT